MKNRHTNNYFFSRMLFFGICTFLFILNSSAQKWTETAKRTVTDFKVAPISDRNSIDRFGHGIAISVDYAISGAYTADHDARGMASKSDAGSAYIYKHTAGTWTLEEKIVASDRGANDLFGVAVAISGDYAIVGAVGESHDTLGGSYSASAGSAYIFRLFYGVFLHTQVRRSIAYWLLPSFPRALHVSLSEELHCHSCRAVMFSCVRWVIYV